MKTKIILSISTIFLIMCVLWFIPVRKHELKINTYIFDVELVNGTNKRIVLKLPDDYNYFVWSRKGTYSLLIEKRRKWSNIYGAKIKLRYETLDFYGVCFVNSVTKN